MKPFKLAVIFSDSQYALRFVASAKPAQTNKALVSCLRQAHTEACALFQVDFHWLRGHSCVGGNERVDLISKRFAKANVPDPSVFKLADPPRFSTAVSEWRFGYPLYGVPVGSFTDLPFFDPMPALQSFGQVVLPPTVSVVPSQAVPASPSRSWSPVSRYSPVLLNPRRSSRIAALNT